MQDETEPEGMNYFALIDLAQVYYQIELEPEERIKTAFVTSDGKYQYTRLPMGLAESPMYFQKFINLVIEGLSFEKCLGYFDDIPCMGRNYPEFLKNLDIVLTRLEKYGLKAKPQKCSFGNTEINFLGHIVNGKGIKPDPHKVEALKNLPEPRNTKQL